MGAQLFNSDMATGIGDGVLRALVDFAVQSGRPELAFTTLFLDGWSWGGQFGYHFTKWRPERVIGFVTQKGGLHDTSPAGAAIEVPGYLVIGELDLPYRIENLTGIFEAHRPLGAKWVLAMEPGAWHGRVTDRNLLDDFFHTAAAHRLPATIPPAAPVELELLEEPAGWLGNRTTQAIGAHVCYDADPDSACWFITRRVGEYWQGFVSDSTVTDTIACPPLAVRETGQGPTAGAAVTGCEVRINAVSPNPFNPATSIVFELVAAGPVRLALYDAHGRRQRTLLDAALPAGRHRVRWDGRDGSGRAAASGVYWCRAETAGGVATRAIVLVR